MTGEYPERILADKIFRTRENLAWCKDRKIRLNGPKLGGLPKDRQEYLEALRMEREESGERNEIERYIGVCKRRYGLDIMIMRLKHTSEVDIYASILPRNLFKKVRHFLRSFLGEVSRGSYTQFWTDLHYRNACVRNQVVIQWILSKLRASPH